MTEDDLLLIIQTTVNARVQTPDWVDIRAIEVGKGAGRVRVEFGALLPRPGASVRVPGSVLVASQGVDRERADDTSAASEPESSDDGAPTLEADDLDTAHL